MAAISQKIIGLIGGVSQQPDSLMIPGQLRECINYYPDPSFGLTKRPGTKYVRRIDNSLDEGSWFFICKGLDDKLLFQIGYDGTTRLWDVQSGEELTINTVAASAQTYASHLKRSDLEVLQINDYVFVLNRSVFVQNDTVNSAAANPYGYVTLETVAYNTTYRITLDGTNFSYSTPSSGSLNANTIISNLTSTINGNANYVATAVANYIHIRRADDEDFSIEASGGLSGTAIKAYKNEIADSADLPAQFLNNAVISIGASDETTADNYYLTFETTDGGNQGAGTWVESVGPDVNLGVDPTTMPHALIKEADGTYSFRELSETAANAFTTETTVDGIPQAASVTSNGNARWNVGQSFAVYGGTGSRLRLKVSSVNDDRQITGVTIVRAGQDYTEDDVVNNNEGDTFTITSVASGTISGSTWATQYWNPRSVGDEESAPDPSFVGERITGISFFKNRLILMSNENIVCSQAGEFLNFYPATVITTIKSDPIDISAGATTRIEFRYGLQRANGLMLFADNSQYVLQTRTEAFAPDTAELNLVSSYSHSIEVPPLDIGNTFVIVEENDTSVAVNELTIRVDDQPLKKELSKLIPSYIPNGIDIVVNSLSASIFGFISVQEPNSVYFFRYYTQDDERLLASWFKWTFPAQVLLIELHEDEIFIVLDADDQPVLCRMELMTETPGGAIEFENKYVDLRMDIFDYYPFVEYVAADEKTRIYFRQGINIADATACLVTLSEDDNSFVTYPDVVEDLAAAADRQYYVEVDGDQSAIQFALGYQYNSEARLPGFYYKKDKQADVINVPTVHRLRVYSHESGPFKSTLRVPGRTTFELTLPQIVADNYSNNAAPMIRTSENIIPIMAYGRDADLTLSCDSPFPLSLVNLVWEGQYNSKGIKPV